MSRLHTPLRHRILWSTGDLILRAYLDLLLRDGLGNWQPKTFRVDSASDMTTLPAYNAKQLGLPLPLQPAPIAHEQTGLDVRSGYLRCRIVGMDPIEYAFPCFFLGDPDTPPNPNTPPARLPHPLLGLSGVVSQVRWTFDATPAGPQAPHGYLIVESV
jgi:hypothetical protein